MSRPQRVVLVGFMGSGKSTVGPLLAEMLGWDFLDLDRAIEARAARSVAEIFRQEGEPSFRLREREAALEQRDRTRLVVAAGGGALLDPATRESLRRRALLVWLRCDLDTALHRIRLDGSRPLLENRERMAQLMAEREACYRRADLAVDAAAGSASDTTRRVWAVVKGPLGLL